MTQDRTQNRTQDVSTSGPHREHRVDHPVDWPVLPVGGSCDGGSCDGGSCDGESSATVIGEDPLGPSPHRIGQAAATAIGAFGREVAALDEARGAPPQQVSVSVSDGFDQLRAPSSTTLNGVGPFTLTDDTGLAGLNGFYPTRDDGWVFMTSTYPHLRNAVCDVLDVPPRRAAVEAATRRWDSHALQEAVVAAGGVAVVAASAQEWATHPVGRYLADRPVVEIERLDDAPARPLPPAPRHGSNPRGAWAPLHGLRVLDNTHVIAGPVATKLMAAFGAEVLHTGTPRRPDPLGMVAMTGGGKDHAYADLDDPSGRAAFDTAVGAADVVVSSYRDLGHRGWNARRIAERSPGAVVAEVHCWGADGPWRSRGGFDDLACAATGIAVAEGAAHGADRPQMPPTGLLNDYLTAYLTAAGVTAALRRRAATGGSWRVRVTLARVAMWVRELGTLNHDTISRLPIPAPSIARHSVEGPLGILTEPIIPITFSDRTTPQPGAPTLPGTASPTFKATEHPQ